MNTIERELKLRPSEPALLDRLAAIDHLGEFSVVNRRHELQRNSFFDSASNALGSAQLGFRRRTIQGQAQATWTLKAESTVLRGVASRTEIELLLDPEMAPVLALDALRSSARQHGASALADKVGSALADGTLPLAMPLLEMETDRRILDLEALARGWGVELALDRVRLLDHTYAELEIEAELKRGDEAALEAVREAIESLGPVRNSEGGKLSRALAHLRTCSCWEATATPTGQQTAP